MVEDTQQLIGLLSITDLAEIMGITVKAVYARRHRGELPPASRRRPLGWTREAVVEYLREEARRDAARLQERRGA